MGYESKRVKYVSVKGKGQKKFLRFRSLGAGYREQDLERIFAGESREKVATATEKTEPKLDMLLDIQKMIAKGKGPGYERWAKVYNIKQMAQTLLFLEEHNLRDYDELAAKAKSVSDRFAEITERQKFLEARLTEITDLKKHIINYSKTKQIYVAWLAHRLTSLHDADNKIIFNNIVIVTDRVVVDRQLQKAIMGMEHKAGLIRVMDDKCNSTDLAIALNGNTKIIATTIQKFPYIVDSVSGLKDKRFAVIIDEAHSSTAGKNMAAVTMALGSGEEAEADVEDLISSEIKRNGKQANVSMFAFTATPKPTTIQLFGRLNKHGQREACHKTRISFH